MIRDEEIAHFWHIVRKYIIIAVLGLSIFLSIMAWLFIGAYFDEMDYINNGKEYTAIYVDIYPLTTRDEDSYHRVYAYEMKYKYINEEGKECYGYGETFYEEETAKSYLGKEVQILENKKGNSIEKPERIPRLKVRIITASIYTAVTGVFVILVIIFRKRIFHFTPKKPKEKKVAKNE